jgi:hypothetical protein
MKVKTDVKAGGNGTGNGDCDQIRDPKVCGC